MQFEFLRLRAAENHPGTLLQLLQPQRDNGACWGVFTGLFGQAANELRVVMLQAPPGQWSQHIVERESWLPTVRPETAAPCSRPGLYVFRRFELLAADVDAFVELSAAAWRTFENAEDYASRPMGLFRLPAAPPGAADETRLQLVTWYDGFESWQRSRQPHAQAAENFAQRRALTRSTIAVATQLVV